MGSVDITQSVRHTLVRNWVDMSRLKIQVAGGTVILRGKIARSREDEPVNGLFVEELMQQIRSSKGVKQVRMNLDDWTHERGQWRQRQL